MGVLTVPHKRRLLTQVLDLESRIGPAPLRNVVPAEIDPDDVDVVAVGCLVLRPDGSTILVRRAETPSQWVIAGGTVDEGEDLVASVLREVKEETGLDIVVDALLRIGLVRDYGPEPFRAVNRARFGRERIRLLFLNFRGQELGGVLDCTGDPSANIMEVRAFQAVPFEQVTHVYKVLFVQQGMVAADIEDYPAVEFDPPSGPALLSSPPMR